VQGTGFNPSTTKIPAQQNKKLKRKLQREMKAKPFCKMTGFHILVYTSRKDHISLMWKLIL
jgi:dihydropteroate synthase